MTIAAQTLRARWPGAKTTGVAGQRSMGSIPYRFCWLVKLRPIVTKYQSIMTAAV